MPRGLPKSVRNFVEKSRSAAMEAVFAYNNPFSRFRTGSFVVHMQIAWTSLLLAIAIRSGKKPFERDAKRKGRYKRRHGRPVYWGIEQAAIRYFGAGRGGGNPIVENILFLKELRDAVEHAEMPELDLEVFGECQACLMNFEDILEKEFGVNYAIGQSLAQAIQFSRIQTSEQLTAIRQRYRPIANEIMTWVDAYRSSLSTDILNNQQYSYKVFLVPAVGSHRSKDSLAVQFIRIDPDNPEHQELMSGRTPVLTREHKVPVIGEGLMKAGAVITQLEKRTGVKLGTNTHRAAAVLYGALPEKGEDKAKTNKKYAVYDSLNGNYGYTEEWVSCLAERVRNEKEYERILAKRKELCSSHHISKPSVGEQTA